MSWGKIISIILVIVVLALAGFAGVVFYNMTNDKNGAENTTGVGPVMETEEFTVNLAESANHFVKARFALEIDNKKAKTELEEKLPLLQDTIIMVLSGQSLESLGTVKGKENLKQSLIMEINKFLTKGKVTKVYFKTFIFG